ncbi:L-type lectin family protein [Glycomyces tarimensis]
MKRTAMFGAGTMMLTAGLIAFPAAAEPKHDEAKALLVEAHFNDDAVHDEHFVPLGSACLTGASEATVFGPCDGEDEGPVPEAGKTPGYLQLTDGGQYETGGVLYDKALVNNGGIEVTFAQYQYGGNGADGISFFIVDGETDLTEAGAYGGSLGYAQHGDLPGVDGGYLGLGIDAWGNFSADTEGRGTGCPAEQRAPDFLTAKMNRAPDNVALRGPGHGTDGYCLIATTASDEVIGSDSQGSLYGTNFPESLATATLGEAKRLVKLKISGDEHPEVTVDIDFGDGWHRVLETQMHEPAPETFKFGFAASSGNAYDVHLLRHLRVETFE